MSDFSANTTTREALSNDFYGYLKHPSGLILPKILRDQLQQSLHEKGDEHDDSNDTNYEESKICRNQDQNMERYWNVTEIVDVINATTQKIQNVQTQILNGEDYYVNNVTSLSVYNSKNNYSDSTTFLDSKTDSTNANNYPSNSNAGGNSTTNSYGMNSNNNQHRWFSSSFTNITPYQQTIPYPSIPNKEKMSKNTDIRFVSSSKPKDSTSNDVASTAAVTTTTSAPSSAALIAGTLPTTATTTAETETSMTLKDTTTTAVLSKRGRSTNTIPQPPPPTRRSTKRRRKT